MYICICTCVYIYVYIFTHTHKTLGQLSENVVEIVIWQHTNTDEWNKGLIFLNGEKKLSFKSPTNVSENEKTL